MVENEKLRFDNDIHKSVICLLAQNTKGLLTFTDD